MIGFIIFTLIAFIHTSYVIFTQPQDLAKGSSQKANLGREKDLLVVPPIAVTAALRGQSHLKFQRPRVNTEGRNTIRTRKDRRKGRTTAGREVIITPYYHKGRKC